MEEVRINKNHFTLLPAGIMNECRTRNRKRIRKSIIQNEIIEEK